MKELVKKIISILVIMLMLVNSSLLLVVSVAIDAVQSVIDESKINTVFELNLEKYLNYTVGEGTKGVLIQSNLKTGIEYAEGQEYQPIKENVISLNLSSINGELPQSVELVGKSTKATNGSDVAKDFTYNYDNASGKLEIVTKNVEDENGNIYNENVAGARDEFEIISYYSQNCYTDTKEERKLNISSNVQTTLANDNATVIKKDFSQDSTVTENISGLISTDVTTSEIYNGYIVSNKENGTSYKTEYTENLGINVSYKNISDEVQINTKNVFLNAKDEEVGADQIIYTSTRLNKNELLNKLGENGYLLILNSNGEVLKEVNKDTEAAEDGTVEIKYEKEVSEFNFKVSKPEQLGTISLQNTKVIKETMQDVANNRVKEKNTISCVNKVEVKDEVTNEVKEVQENKVYEFADEKTEEIKNATTNANLVMNNVNWDNKQQNEVTFDVAIDTNTSKSKLLKNPSFKINLPSQVEKVIINNSSIVYGEGLKLETPTVQTNQDGTLSIVANVTGSQTQYLENQLNLLTDIKIIATVTLKKDIKNTDEKVTLNYTNEYNQKEEGTKEVAIKVESYQEETTQTASPDVTYSQALVVENEVGTAQDVNALKMEVAPVKGDVTVNNGDVVYEGEFIKYNVKLTNTSDKDLANVKVVGTVPDGTTYGELEAEYFKAIGKYQYNYDENVKSKTINVENIKAGEIVNVFYEVRVDDLGDSETEKTINTNIKTYIDENEVSNADLTNKVKSAEVKVLLTSQLDNMKDKWNYTFSIEGQEEQNGQTVTVKIKIPSIYSPYMYYDGIKHEIKSEQISDDDELTLNDIVVGKTYTIHGFMHNSLISKQTNESTVTLYAIATVNINNVDYKSNENRILFSYPNVTISMTSSNEGEELKYEDEIDYEITIKNIGKTNIDNDLYDSIPVRVKDFLPEDINPISITYMKQIYNDDGTLKEEVKTTEDISTIQTDSSTGEALPNVDVYFDIPYGETRVISVKATAGFVFEKTKIENNAVVEGAGEGTEIKAKTSNTIIHTILPNNTQEPEEPVDPENPEEPEEPVDPENPEEPENPEDPENPENSGKEWYSIKGTAWLDENEDGQRQTSESDMSEIEVSLIDTTTGLIVKDKDENEKKTKTGEDGTYEFTNLAKGSYIVIFQYDKDKYSLTAYNKAGINESYNSDAIDKTITINGESMTVAATDIINLTSDKDDIDIGLIEKKVFDLKLDKYVSKISVQTKSGTKQTTYDNSKLAKVEIKAKELKGATVVVEYKIVVTNEGEVTATVGKVIDYLPDGLKFSSELNKQWATNKNGELVNTSCSEKRVKPGESITLSLVLIKQISSSEIGKFTNKAEIGEESNIYKISDKDSTPGNKKEGEDDYSQADVIISISTGIITCVFAIIISLIILVIVILLIHKFGLSKIRKVMMFFLVITLIFGLNVSETKAATKWEELAGSDNLKDYSLRGFTNKIVNKEQTTEFYGGPKDYGGTCVEHGVWAYSGDYLMLDGTFSYKNGSVLMSPYWNAMKWINGGHVDSTIKLTNLNKNDNIAVKKINNKYVFGPFKVKCLDENDNEYQKGYTYEIKDEDGKIINRNYYTTCDSNGKEVTVKGSATFYIKIAEDKCTNGIGKVKISISRNGYSYDKYVQDGHALYRAKEEKNGLNYQDVKTKPTNANGVEVDTFVKKFKKTETTTNTKSTEWTRITTPKGSLKIIKKDADTGKLLNGAKFKITGPLSYNKTVTITSGGTITIKNLPLGKYTVTEIATAKTYRLSLQTDKTQTAVIGAAKTKTLTFKNRKYGDLKIIKIDKNTQEAIKSAGFKFVVFSGTTSAPKYIKTYKKGTPSEITTTTKLSEAHKFSTDANGEILIKNIPLGKDRTYYVKEVGMPEFYQHVYDIVKTPKKVILKNNYNSKSTAAIVTTTKFNNPQQYVNLSGYVWEDVGSGKGTIGNALWDDKTEKKIANIPVKLIDKTTGKEKGTTTTDKNGNYIFYGKENQILIKELSNYYIEFEYNGLKYQSVGPNLKASNGSKASDVNRDILNNKFTSIEGGNAKTTDKTTGYANNENDKKASTLTYKSVNAEGTTNGASIILDNMSHTVSSAKEEVNPNSAVSIKANTETTKYYVGTWKAGVYEIKNINLGIRERPQIDIATKADLDNVELDINGYSHTYKYKQTDNIKDQNSLFTVKVKNGKTGENEFTTLSYTREIYKSYIAYTKEHENDDTRLRAFVTYVIDIRNENQGGLTAGINKIKNYCDENFTVQEVYDNNGEKYKAVENTALRDATNKLKVYEISREDNANTTEKETLKIESSKTETLYIKYEISTKALLSLIDNVTYESKVPNTFEIASYSTYDKEGKIYASIDVDSAPDNVKIKVNENGSVDKTTYENDTCAAPPLIIKRGNNKEISGTVFEDDILNKTAGEEKLGNGKHESKENLANNVKVELVNLKGETVKLYDKDMKEQDAIAITNKKGQYTLDGVIPGEYYIKYTYGTVKGLNGENLVTEIYKTNGTKVSDVTVQDYKSTIVKETNIKGALQKTEEVQKNSQLINDTNKLKSELGDRGYWYVNKENIKDYDDYSSAVDNYAERETINKSLIPITNETKTTYNNNNNISANTPILLVAIEDKTYEGMTPYGMGFKYKFNVSFGIVERPKQRLGLNKDISNVKLIMANGQALLDGNPKEGGMNYVSYLRKNNTVKIEVDNEIIQGSTLVVDYTISVTNSSDIDYDDEIYYKYGEIPKNKKPVQTTINSVVDYMSEELVKGQSQSDITWKNKSADELKDDKLISADVYQAIKDKKNIFVNDCNVSIDVGKTVDLPLITASRLLSASTSSDMLYDNYAEVIKVSNNSGKFYEDNENSEKPRITPGNFDITKPTETHESDDDSVRITIVPPTGVEKVVIYSAIGVSCLIILAGGIILIKKIVL